MLRLHRSRRGYCSNAKVIMCLPQMGHDGEKWDKSVRGEHQNSRPSKDLTGHPPEFGLTRQEPCATLLADVSCHGPLCLPSLIFICNCLMISFLLVCCAVTMLAQGAGPTADNGLRDSASLYITAPGTGIVVATVSAEKKNGHLDRQALLQIDQPVSPDSDLADHKRYCARSVSGRGFARSVYQRNVRRIRD